MTMTKKSNARQIPFASTDQMRVLAKFKPDEVFVFHTLCRVSAEVLKVDYRKAEAVANDMITSGVVVPASNVGLTGLQTFKLSDQ